MKVPLRIPLMSNRPRCSPPLRFGVWNARPLKTKVSSLCDLLLSRSLDHLSVTESWLTSNGSITTVDLTNSIEDYAVYHLPRSKIQDLDHLSVTELWLTSNDSIADLTNSLEDYAVYHSPRSTRRGGGLAVIARKGLHVSRNKGCILSSLKHFDLTITSGDKVYRLVTVYRPQPSKKKWLYSRKVFLRTLYVLRGVDCYILSIPCSWWFQLSRQWQLKCKPQTIFWLSFFCWSVIPYSSSLRTHLGTGRRDVKKPFALWNVKRSGIEGEYDFDCKSWNGEVVNMRPRI